MAKQSALNSKSVIIIVNHGGHFWQCFNLTDTKGHICQMDAGKPQPPTFQNTSCHICEFVYKTARWKKERRKKNSNCYCMPLLHSAAITDITFGCKTLTEKDFVSKLQKSTCINMHNSGCTPDPCKHKHCYGVCCKRPHRRPLSCSYPA